AEKPIGLQSIIQLIVVRGRIQVFMPRERIILAEQFEDRLNVIVDVGLDEGRAEAAIIFGVVDNQRWPRRPHGSEVRIVLTGEEILRNLLVVSVVAYALELRYKCGVSGNRNGHRDSGVERAQDNRLPAASGEPGYAQASTVYIGMLVEVIQALPHGQIEQSDSVRAHQVKLSCELMLVFRNVQLTAIQPFQTQCKNASFGEVDTALLFVFGRLAQLQLMTVWIENSRDLAIE